MSTQPEWSNNPVIVYDRVTQAWRLLLGEDLHYGYFVDAVKTLPDATAALTRLMEQWAGLRAGDQVLDVGCGIGNPARWMAAGFGCSVKGISTSAVGLAHAAELTKAQQLDHLVTFQQADGMNNGLPDSSFDCAWIMESSHLMPRKNDLIAESARVLRPGGRLVLCDIILCRQLALPELMSNLGKFKCLDAVFGTAKMDSLDTYAKLAEKNGLEVERVQDISVETQPTFEHWLSNAHLNREPVIELVGETYWRQFTESCEYLSSFWDSKTLGYGIIRARKPA